MSGPRFKPIPPDEMTAEQKRVVQALTDGPRGGLRGPFPALLRLPELADRVRLLGDYVRFEGTLPGNLRELAILVVARFWSARYEWYAHSQHAVKAGVDPSVPAAIAKGERPPRLSADEALVYDVCVELLHDRDVDPSFVAAAGWTLVLRKSDAFPADPAALACPACGTASEHVKERVVTHPADIGYGREQVSVAWVKRRWECRVASCPRQTFTESLPSIPPRCGMTGRLREQAGQLVAEGGRTVTAAARECGLSWPVAQQAFAQRADPLLGQPPGPVAHLGIDEHRRGRPRWRADPETGEYVLLADRWHTCFFDLSGDQGLLGQVEGRTADDAAYWLAGAPPAWRDAARAAVCSGFSSSVTVLPTTVFWPSFSFGA